MTGIEIGLELGFDHGRTSALLEAENVSGNAATVLVARLADLLGDTKAGHLDVILALVAALRAPVMGQLVGRAADHEDSRYFTCVNRSLPVHSSP